MRNIFLFIRRYLYFISFLLLQVTAILLLSNASKTHESFLASYSNEITGRINKKYSGFTEYFSLKEINQQLTLENSQLRQQLAMNFVSQDSSKINKIDTLVKDSLGKNRKYIYLPAKVVGNTYTLQTNFITIERGRLQGVKKGMAAVGPNGIVGVVTEVGDHFSKIMSLIHRNSKVSAMLKKDNNAGSIEWDGADPSFLILRNVSKSAKILKGDTVVTSTYSANFPSQLLVGTVAEIVTESSSNFNSLKIKTATNFYSLQFVYLIENLRYTEQVQLENNPQKN